MTPAEIGAALGAGPRADEVLAMLDAALSGDAAKAGQFIEALGPAALDAELAERIIPLAKTVPAAAEVASRKDPAVARSTAELSLRKAAAGAKGKHQKVLKRALVALDR